MKIWGHTLVRNEANWLWYSVESAIALLDKLLIWDTGSIDGTVDVIKELERKYPDKIVFREYGKVDAAAFTTARQEMLDNTKSDWVFILDADEVWWNDSVRKVVETIRNNTGIESVVVPTYNMVGDLFHYQEAQAGRYNLLGKEGHYNLRAFSMDIPGLHAQGEHGVFGWNDKNENRIENRDPKKILFIDAAYMHMTHLKRSDSDSDVAKRSKKFKYENGIQTPLDFYYPEAFFKSKPEVIKSPWNLPDSSFKIRSFFETPIKKIYRRTLLKTKQHGY